MAEGYLKNDEPEMDLPGGVKLRHGILAKDVPKKFKGLLQKHPRGNALPEKQAKAKPATKKSASESEPKITESTGE